MLHAPRLVPFAGLRAAAMSCVRLAQPGPGCRPRSWLWSWRCLSLFSFSLPLLPLATHRPEPARASSSMPSIYYTVRSLQSRRITCLFQHPSCPPPPRFLLTLPWSCQVSSIFTRLTSTLQILAARKKEGPWYSPILAPSCSQPDTLTIWGAQFASTVSLVSSYASTLITIAQPTRPLIQEPPPSFSFQHGLLRQGLARLLLLSQTTHQGMFRQSTNGLTRQIDFSQPVRQKATRVHTMCAFIKGMPRLQGPTILDVPRRNGQG